SRENWSPKSSPSCGSTRTTAIRSSRKFLFSGKPPKLCTRTRNASTVVAILVTLRESRFPSEHASFRSRILWTLLPRLGFTVLLTAGLAVACVVLPQGLPRVAISDIVSALLMLSALYVFASNGAGSKGRTRWFWMLQAIGWGLWFCDQLVWIFFDLVRQKRMPDMYPSDALLFLSGAPMIAGLLLRPHRKPTARSARLGMLDFL